MLLVGQGLSESSKPICKDSPPSNPVQSARYSKLRTRPKHNRDLQASAVSLLRHVCAITHSSPVKPSHVTLDVPQLHWATLVREYVRVRVWQSTGTRRSNKTATRLLYGGPTSLAAGFVSGPRRWLQAQRRRLGLCVHTRPEFDDDGRFNF